MHLNVLSRKPRGASDHPPLLFVHGMMLENGWRAVADAIAEWLESRKV